MKQTGIYTLLFIAIYLLLPFHTQAQPDEGLRKIIENKEYNIDGQPLFCKKTLPEFYYSRGFERAWTHEDNINELIEQIKLASEEGLQTEDYHYEYLKENFKGLKSMTPALDVLLTDAYLLYASHLLSGKVNPEKIVAEWQVNRKETDLKILLSGSLENIEIARSLNGLKPKYKTYVRLKRALRLYREIETKGGWPVIEGGETLRTGMTDPRVEQIRNRLFVTGDISTTHTDSVNLFDSTIEEAIKTFQRRHGLEPDGAVGKSSLAILNEPVEKRIEQIILNMERCRWLPLDLGEHYILVNIANYELEVIKNGKLEMEMSVVVGKPYRKTPVFSNKMMYLVFNPYWTVPPTIFANDVLPAIRKNVGYLRTQNMKVISGDTEIDPSSIAWAEVTPKNFPYQIRQDPGPNNALGQVKFIFPNAYNVYMHDTNHRELFSKTDRALSSGCIRLSKPIDMAEYVLKHHPAGWTREKIDKTVGKEKNLTVMLSEEIYVHLLYWTSFVDEHDRINFRKDIYERDGVLWKAMQQGPPSI
ncbi:L,D-transpeptidase family protein [Fulvivirga ulvae]|uniref:L,D-transpeptidase family protein n=1 Tax=Fulvivirga ulvae TaxID=2904245 RepID=UPI001F013177|nr:L,D-transpeptidase family protein [Fulvivirga ulvae]UII32558.1 L,D-transpeptidase family protein [Fulvivirga ulvae]